MDNFVDNVLSVLSDFTLFTLTFRVIFYENYTYYFIIHYGNLSFKIRSWKLEVRTIVVFTFLVKLIKCTKIVYFHINLALINTKAVTYYRHIILYIFYNFLQFFLHKC